VRIAYLILTTVDKPLVASGTMNPVNANGRDRWKELEKEAERQAEREWEAQRDREKSREAEREKLKEVEKAEAEKRERLKTAKEARREKMKDAVGMVENEKGEGRKKKQGKGKEKETFVSFNIIQPESRFQDVFYSGTKAHALDALKGQRFVGGL
jgi:hypothetical protein